MSATAGRRGIPFVVAAPSGTGKTTVCQRVVTADAPIAHLVVDLKSELERLREQVQNVE